MKGVSRLSTRLSLMQIVEIWSIPYERIRDFFLAQDDVRILEEGCFSCGQCEVRLLSLPFRRVGRFSFPQTYVEFSGPDTDTEKIHRRFVLQFTSAGG